MSAMKNFFFSILFSMTQQPLVDQSLIIIEVSRSPSDAPHSAGLLWTGDQPDAQTSTWEHTTFTTQRLSCPRRDSKPQSQQVSGRRSTPETARLMGWAFLFHTAQQLAGELNEVHSCSPVCSLSPLDSTSDFRSGCCIIWWSRRNRVCLFFFGRFLKASLIRITATFTTVDVSTHIQCRP